MLLDLLGEEALLALSREYSGCDVYVPRFEMVLRSIRKREAASDLLRGLSPREVAVRHRLRVREVLRMAKFDHSPPDNGS
ncbi:MAG: hypothetical protein BWK73_13985 [Thiothrix lacustris]|uniref:Mor transcription activator domain-containing protein n=1 Tax=Thiothrix lacustris TaxID=525917 RepID=A0A1Y1QT81_9GAMM|nr:MAG: hypothetical protein BWK73_13985 [Thiothrix lacustris]